MILKKRLRILGKTPSRFNGNKKTYIQNELRF